MDLPADFPVIREEWDKTSRSVQVVMITLWQENQKLRQQMAHMQVEMEKLAERVNKNSQNSSKPPSSDTFSKSNKYPKKEASGQKKGGQAGHKGKGRKLKPLDQVNKVVVLKPTACTECGSLLLGEDAHPQRHQVSELPRIVPGIVEHGSMSGLRNRKSS